MRSHLAVLALSVAVVSSSSAGSTPADIALFNKDSGGKLTINGNNILVNGSGHSEKKLVINGNDIVVTEPITYTNSKTISGNGIAVTAVQSGSRPDPELPVTMSELYAIAQAAGTVFSGDAILSTSGAGIRVQANPTKVIPDGSVVYVQGGKITINGNGFNHALTMVSTGEITVNGGNARLEAAHGQVLARAGGKITVNGNDHALRGILDAGDEVKLNGNNIEVSPGALWGEEVTLNGNHITISKPDIQPPLVAITFPLNGFLSNSPVQVVRWTVDGAPMSTDTLETLSEGLNTITRSATNAAGLTGTASVSGTLDTQAPVVAITWPAAGT